MKSSYKGARERTHVSRDGQAFDVNDPLLPDLQPGESRTMVPDWWCENCAQARPLKKCSVCGHRTVLRSSLPDDPAADDVVALAKLQGLEVPPGLVQLELPPDDAGGVIDDVQAAEPRPMGARRNVTFVHDHAEAPELAAAAELADIVPTVHIGPVDAPPDPQGDLEAEAFGTDALKTDAPAVHVPPARGVLLPRAPGGLLGALEESRAKREAAVEALPASSIRPAMNTYSDRERAIMERPRGPMARGAVDRPSHRGPVQETKRPRERTIMQSTRAATQHELDDRGRPVQHTVGRSKTRTVEDQLIGQWETAKVDRTIWSTFLASAMGRADVTSVADAADLADEAYMELLRRDRYATGG